MSRAVTEFLAIVLSLPTAPFTVAAVLAVAWWAFSIASGVDTDGGGHGIDLDGDGDVDIEVDADGLLGKLGELLSLLGVGSVPITLWVTMFSLTGWTAAFAIGWAARHAIPLPPLAVALGGTLLSVLVGAVGARIGAVPLAPLFRTQHGRSRASLLGETAQVTTIRVDAGFGQARVLVGGDDLVIQVRCDAVGSALARDGHVLIVGWDERREAYVVEPLSPGQERAAGRARGRQRDRARE